MTDAVETPVGDTTETAPVTDSGTTGDATIQSSSVPSVSDAIKAAMAEDNESSQEDSPKETPQEQEPEDEPEDKELTEDTDEDSSDEDESEESEDAKDELSDEEKSQGKYVTRKRLNKVSKRLQASEAGLKELQATHAEVVSERDKFSGAQDFLQRILAASKVDSRIADIVESNWVFNGKEPSLDDFDKPEDYQSWIKSEAEARIQLEQSQKVSEETSKKESEEQVANWESEMETLQKDSVLKEVLTEENSKKVWERAASFLEASKGNDLGFDSIEQIVRFMFSKEIAKAERKVGATEAVNRSDKAKRQSMLNPSVPGVTPSVTQADLQNMSVKDHIRHLIQSG